MRERLMAVLVGLTVAVILLFGVPRAYSIASLVESQEIRKLDDAVDLLAVVVDARQRDGDPITPDYLATLINPGEGVQYRGSSGSVVMSGAATTDPAMMARHRNLASTGSIALARPRSAVTQRTSEALVPLVVTGLTVTVIAAAVGFGVARMLARPFQELALNAAKLGSGRFDEVKIKRYPIPEAENIGEALRTSAEQLEEHLQRQRDFAANASHQLRTPITALRLQLEDLSMWDETHPVVAAELQASLSELDRLSAAVTDYLEMAKGQRRTAATDFDLTELGWEIVRRWRPRLQAAGRDIRLDDQGPVPIRLRRGSVEQLLEILVENALKHGKGTATLTITTTPKYVVAEVADEGRRPSDPNIFKRGVSNGDSTGVGLALATEIAQAQGGRLELDRGRTTAFRVLLPASDKSAVA